MPVIKHLDGVCHVFIDEHADVDMAIRIADNAKTQRYSPCNTMETLLVHERIAPRVLPALAQIYTAKGVELRGDPRRPDDRAGDEAGDRGRLAHRVSRADSFGARRRVGSTLRSITSPAMARSTPTPSSPSITATRCGSLREVDSSSVMVNASTRFADGFEYGLGREIGISTNKLHARGPVGLEGLTSRKWVVLGSGQIRTNESVQMRSRA